VERTAGIIVSGQRESSWFYPASKAAKLDQLLLCVLSFKSSCKLKQSDLAARAASMADKVVIGSDGPGYAETNKLRSVDDPGTYRVTR